MFTVTVQSNRLYRRLRFRHAYVETGVKESNGFEAMFSYQSSAGYYSGYVRALVMDDDDVPANVRPCGAVGFHVER